MTSNFKASDITNAIVKHIFTGLGIYSSTPVSIYNPAFLTDKTIPYVDYQDNSVAAPIWACQTEVSQKKLSIIGTKLNLSNLESWESDMGLQEDIENFVVVKFDANPAYGLYLFSGPDDRFDETHANYGYAAYSDGFLATELKPKAWIPTTVYLQATFLAGMEQLRDLTSKYESVKDLEKLYDLLKDFISYREDFFEVANVEASAV